MPDILIVSRYVDPFPQMSNRNVFLQAECLKKKFGIDLEILTWPHGDDWTGPKPSIEGLKGMLKLERAEIIYNVLSCPERFNSINGGNLLDFSTWKSAVKLGELILKKINPKIVHLHHRQGMDWFLESAQNLGIKTVYTNHDWGLSCLRSSLYMGDGRICDGIVQVEKCSKCLRNGRRTWYGWFNEFVVSFSLGREILRLMSKIIRLNNYLISRNVVTMSSFQRASLNLKRSENLVSNLSHLFTPSLFGRTFFSQFGLNKEKITVLPWYTTTSVRKKVKSEGSTLELVYVGRVSPEKGVDLIFSALEVCENIPRLKLVICGLSSDDYYFNLREKYNTSVGIHDVIWLGWSNVQLALETADFVVIPSRVMDNTPLSLVESLSMNVPVIVPNIPSFSDLVHEGENGIFFKADCSKSLSEAIESMVFHVLNNHFNEQNNSIDSLDDYASSVIRIYKRLYPSLNSKLMPA